MNRRRLLIATALALLLVGYLGYRYYRRARAGREALAASGTVEATQAALGFSAGGRIVAILAREGELVKAGALLAQLDTVELVARLAETRAQVAAQRAQLLELERGSRPAEIAQARAALESAEHALADAVSDLERTTRLAAGNVVSRQQLDKAQLAHAQAQARYDQATAELSMLEEGPRVERIAAVRAQVAAAEAQARALEAMLQNLSLRAPFDGIVSLRHHEPGETVNPGAPVLTVLNPADRWVRIYIAEDQIGTVRLGGAATISSDSYPGKEFSGEVTFIAQEAEFTPRNVQTTAERVKLVYAVKVRIMGDSALELKVGTPADVRVGNEGMKE